MAEPSKTNGAAEEKIKVTRSPSYPSMPLKEALSKAAKLWEKGKKFPLALAATAGAMEYGPKSSTFSQVLATLRAYGLIDVTGNGDDRKAVVSELGQKIIMNHSDRPRLLKEAALKPPVFRELWDKFHLPTEGLAPDDAMKQYLQFDRAESQFNLHVIGPLIADFKETVEFARLLNGDTMSTGTDKVSEGQTDKDRPRVGDLAQWTSQGVAQFPEGARRVTGFSDDGAWVFFEGCPTGVAVADVVVVQRSPVSPKESAMTTTVTPPLAPVAPTAPLAPLAPPSAGMEESRWKLPSGHATLRYPSKLTARDFKVLKQQIELLEFAITDDDEEAGAGGTAGQ